MRLFRPLLAATVFLALLAVPASAAAPAATALPTITGNPRAGQILTATTGLFAGTAPLTYGRAWQRCDETGAACVPIAAAGAATYTLAAADVGRTIRVAVTATNLEGLAPMPPNGGARETLVGTWRDGVSRDVVAPRLLPE